MEEDSNKIKQNGDETIDNNKPLNNVYKIEIKVDSKEDGKEKVNNEFQNKINYRENEMLIGPKPVPIDIIDKVKKSICKMIIENKKDIFHYTGFFMKINNSKKYLITA